MGKLNGDVVLKCNTSEQQVTWTQNGEPEPMAELVAEGQTLTIIGLDLPAAGNYSCWAGPVLLDTTYVVVSGTRTRGWARGPEGATGRSGGDVGRRGSGACRDLGAGWGPGDARPSPDGHAQPTGLLGGGWAGLCGEGARAAPEPSPLGPNRGGEDEGLLPG